MQEIGNNNGGPKKLPALVIGWDAQSQAVELQLDPKEFKTWDFVLAVLDMARQKAEEQKRMAVLAAMQQQQAAAAQDAAIRRSLGRH